MVNNHKAGIVFGAFAGLVHLAWSLLVWSGYAATWLDYVMGLHFLDISYDINDFSFGTAVMLVIVTTVLGYIVGYLFATLWNWVHR